MLHRPLLVGLIYAFFTLLVALAVVMGGYLLAEALQDSPLATVLRIIGLTCLFLLVVVALLMVLVVAMALVMQEAVARETAIRESAAPPESFPPPSGAAPQEGRLPAERSE